MTSPRYGVTPMLDIVDQMSVAVTATNRRKAASTCCSQFSAFRWMMRQRLSTTPPMVPHASRIRTGTPVVIRPVATAEAPGASVPSAAQYGPAGGVPENCTVPAAYAALDGDVRFSAAACVHVAAGTATAPEVTVEMTPPAGVYQVIATCAPVPYPATLENHADAE